MFGLPYVEKLWRYVKQFSFQFSSVECDGRTSAGSKPDPLAFFPWRLQWGLSVFQWGSNPHNPPRQFLPWRAPKCVVLLRLLVINISSSSPAINTATYYKRCVTTCETLAVVHRRLCWQHWPIVALTAGIKARYGSESRILFTPPAIDAPVREGGWTGCRRNIAMPFGV